MTVEKLKQTIESVDHKMRVSRYPTHDELNALLAAARLLIGAVEAQAQEAARVRAQARASGRAIMASDF